MTKEEKLEWKKQALIIIDKHLLEKLGYPNCTNHDIMSEVSNLWRLLEENKLIKPGMTYQGFFNEAQREFQKAEFQNTLRNMGVIF